MNASITWWYGLYKQQTRLLQRAFKSVHQPRNFKLYICLSNFLQAVGFLLAAVHFSFKHLQWKFAFIW